MVTKASVKDALYNAYEEAIKTIDEQDNLNNLDNVEITIWGDVTRVMFTFREENFIGSGISQTEKNVDMALAKRIQRENF